MLVPGVKVKEEQLKYFIDEGKKLQIYVLLENIF